MREQVSQPVRFDLTQRCLILFGHLSMILQALDLVYYSLLISNLCNWSVLTFRESVAILCLASYASRLYFHVLPLTLSIEWIDNPQVKSMLQLAAIL